MLCDVTVYSAYATKQEAPNEFWKKKIEEAVQNDLDWSGEIQLGNRGMSWKPKEG